MLQAQAGRQELIGQFVAALRALPEVAAGFEARTSPDENTELALQIAGTALRALIEVRKSVYPRDVREIVWRARHLAHPPGHREGATESGHSEPLTVLIAESISPGAKDLLRAERIGYYDSGGSLYLPARGAYLYIDRSPPKALSRSMRTLFTGRRAQVLHGLLVRHHDWLGVKELAELTLVSPATASGVMSELDRLDWMESRGRGPAKQRRLHAPAALLDAWVKELGSTRPLPLQRYFVPAMKADALIERLARVCEARRVGYCISFEAAAQRYAPFLSAVSKVHCRLLVSPGMEAVIADLGGHVVNDGANLAIIKAESTGELLFSEPNAGVWLASPIQVYLDLQRSEGRSTEMAEHLRRERIGF